MAGLFFLAFSLALYASASPLIIDTDIGTDIDDSWVVALAASQPSLDLRLILTATFNTPLRTKILAKQLTLSGINNLPIGVGVYQSDTLGPLQDWAADFNMSDYPGPFFEDGVSEAIHIINESTVPVTVLCIAPLPNIQKILKTRPDLASKIIIKAMSGSINICYSGAPGGCPEYNVVIDVPASQLTYSTTWNFPMTIAPIDVGWNASFSGNLYQQLLKAMPSTPVISSLIESYTFWAAHGGAGNPKTGTTTLWDPVAFYMTVFPPNLLNFKEIPVSVNDKGVTIQDEKGQPVNCALSWVNGNSGRDQWAKLVVDILTHANHL